MLLLEPMDCSFRALRPLPLIYLELACSAQTAILEGVMNFSRTREVVPAQGDHKNRPYQRSFVLIDAAEVHNMLWNQSVKPTG
jgi:hypothetical protein